jgi:3-dehydroquinate synthase
MTFIANHIKIQPFAESLQGLDRFSKIAVLVDHNTSVHCYQKIKDQLPPHFLISIPEGEIHKNLQTCQIIWDALTNYEFDRNSLLINLGGGVVGDMGGFCAATFKRGITFVQAPTTLLAQVDASVGGKLGIDFRQYKNHIGVFAEPEAVWIDTAFLDTLPERELRSGFAEVIKHCLIADSQAWDALQSTSLAQQNWNQIVAHSVAIKSGVVSEDPTEKGLRKILNFGHTIGHAVESYFLDKQPLLHGEAIAIGMICEAWLSVRLSGLSKEEFYQTGAYLLSVFGKENLPADAELSTIAQLALQDKKNKAGQIQCVLLKRTGEAVYDVPVSQNDIVAALRYYQSLEA